MTVSEDGAKVQCHACGRWFRSLNTHIKTHGMDGATYKEAFGLPRTASMLPPATQERYRAATLARDQGEIGKAFLPPATGREKGIANRLGTSIRASQQRKGRYRGKPIDEG